MRGVNKLVVEINNPDSEYFEKAILFLRADKINAPQSEINQNADKLLSAAINSRKKNWGLRLTLIMIGLIGVLLVAIGVVGLLAPL